MKNPNKLPMLDHPPVIHVYPADVDFEGSCNACQRRDDPTVYVVSLRSISVRLCATCAHAVIGDLKDCMRKERR